MAGMFTEIEKASASLVALGKSEAELDAMLQAAETLCDALRAETDDCVEFYQKAAMAALAESHRAFSACEIDLDGTTGLSLSTRGGQRIAFAIEGGDFIISRTDIDDLYGSKADGLDMDSVDFMIEVARLLKDTDAMANIESALRTSANIYREIEKRLARAEDNRKAIETAIWS